MVSVARINELWRWEITLDAGIVPISGPDVQNYISAALANAHQGLDVAFDGAFDLGRTFVIAPLGTPEENLRRFSSGGIAPTGPEFRQNGMRVVQVNSYTNVLAGLIAQHAQNRRDSVLILYDPLCKPEVYEAAREKFDLSSKPFVLIERRILSEDEVFDKIEEIRTSWSCLAAVVASPEKVLTPEDFIEAVSFISVGAYDGESSINWERIDGK